MRVDSRGEALQAVVTPEHGKYSAEGIAEEMLGALRQAREKADSKVAEIMAPLLDLQQEIGEIGDITL